MPVPWNAVPAHQCRDIAAVDVRKRVEPANVGIVSSLRGRADGWQAE